MREKILTDDFPLSISPKCYAFFIYHGRVGIEAMSLYLHLQYTARKQSTTQLYATKKYLMKGLQIGEDKLKTLKAFLHKHGFIKYVQAKAGGQFGYQYICLRYNPGGVNITPAVASTGGVDFSPPENYPTINASIQKKEKCLKEKKEEESRPPAVDDQAPPVHDNFFSGDFSLTKKKSKKLAEDSDAYKLASRMYEVLCQRNPDIEKPNLQRWARDMDLMIRIDKRTPAAIEGKLLGVQDDDFWHRVILSPSKLRQKWKEGRLAHIKRKVSDDERKTISRCYILTEEEYLKNFGVKKPYSKEEAEVLLGALSS